MLTFRLSIRRALSLSGRNAVEVAGGDEDLDQTLDAGLILFVEALGARAVQVQHTPQHLLAVLLDEHRDDQLAARGGVTGDMAREGVYVRDTLDGALGV